MAVLIVLSIWGGLYAVGTPEENIDTRVTSNDPLSVILYSPVGNAVVLLVLQFFLANVLFWSAVWVGLRIGRRGRE